MRSDLEWDWIAEELRERPPTPWPGPNAGPAAENPWRGVVAQLIEKVEKPADRVAVLRVYTHALREEESDLSFLDFGGTKRHLRGTALRRAVGITKPPRANTRRGLEILEHETGLEPATPTLAKGRRGQRRR
jgi:hypothetical protein